MKRILRKIEVHEISGVTFPTADPTGIAKRATAEEHARARKYANELFAKHGYPPGHPLHQQQEESNMRTNHDDDFQLDRLERDVEVLEKLLTKSISVATRKSIPITTDEDDYGDDGKPSSFDRHVQEIAKRDNVPTLVAMATARKQFPVDFKMYQKGTSDLIAKAAAKHAPQPDSAAMAKFGTIVDQIQSDHGLSRCDALRKARIEHGNEFRQAYR